MKWRHGANQL